MANGSKRPKNQKTAGIPIEYLVAEIVAFPLATETAFGSVDLPETPLALDTGSAGPRQGLRLRIPGLVKRAPVVGACLSRGRGCGPHSGPGPHRPAGRPG